MPLMTRFGMVGAVRPLSKHSQGRVCMGIIGLIVVIILVILLLRLL